MEIFSRYNVSSTLVTLSHRREQRKQRRASIDTEVGTDYAFNYYSQFPVVAGTGSGNRSQKLPHSCDICSKFAIIWF